MQLFPFFKMLLLSGRITWITTTNYLGLNDYN